MKKLLLTITVGISVFALSARAGAKVNIHTVLRESAGTDTVECLYHQVLSNNKPALSWGKGYIITENAKINVGNKAYHLDNAATITGVIQNTFLKRDRKTIVKNKVIQIVLL